MGTTLQVYAGTPLQLAKRWVDLDPAERRLRAIEALRDRDADALIELTLSYQTLFGKAGAKGSRHTVSAYALSIRHFLRDTTDANLLHLTRERAALWIRSLETDGKAASTIQVRLAGVRALYRALRWAGALDIDPLADVRPAKDKTESWTKRAPYSDADVQRLLAAASPVDRVMVLLGAHAGFRAFEMCGCRWAHLDAGRERLFVHGKGRKDAWVAASQSLLAALAALPRDGEYVLPYRTTKQARNQMRRLCAAAGVPFLALHSLRHACGTRLQGQANDISRTARHLRHANVSTSQVYIHYAEDALKQSVGDW